MPKDPNRNLAFRQSHSTFNIPRGKNYLLVIGINAYQNGIHPLSNAVRDAQAFRDLLWRKYQFNPEHTYELFDGQATRSAIINVFYELIERLTAEDNLIFYFAGHGELHRTTKRGFWISADSQNGDTSTYLNNLEIIDFLNNFKARHVFGIVDSCFSAALFAQRSMDAATQRQFSIPSRWLLTAGRLEPVSDGTLGRHSPFAESLLQQLAYPSGPALWGSELCQKVLRGVAFNSDQQMPRGEPLQQAGHQGGEFVFLPKGTEYSSELAGRAEESGEESRQAEARAPEGSRPVYVTASGQSVVLDPLWLEQSGKKKQIELILSKLNYLQEALIVETGASQKFKLEQEIKELEDKLLALSGRV